MLVIEYVDSAPSADLEKDRGRHDQATLEMNESTVRVQRQINPHSWKAAVLASVVILAGAGYISWRHFRSLPPPRKVMLAVLPFENLTGDPNKEYLADGLTEETISQFGRLNPEQLGVIARTSVMGYKHKDERLDQIGRDLSVQYVLENSIRESENHLRLTAQLIQVRDQTHLWSQDYDFPSKDILNVEDEVAKAVAREIRLRLTSQQQADLSQSRPVNPEDFDAYLQGYYFFQGNTDKDAEMAARYYERATQLDPGYALAWVGLSRVRNWEANLGVIPVADGQRQARVADDRALALNPNLAEAHVQMGRIKRQIDFDWARGMLPSSARDCSGTRKFRECRIGRYFGRHARSL
jgi:TolB-like protein